MMRDQKIKELDAQFAEKEGQLAEKQKALLTSAKALKDAGIPLQQISAMTSLSFDTIKIYNLLCIS